MTTPPQPTSSSKPLIIVSTDDPASVNITERFLEILELKNIEPLRNVAGREMVEELLEYRDFFLLWSRVEHLYLDDIDEFFEELTGSRPAFIIFPSKHRSEAGIKSLTIHPTGNFGKAEYGGKDRAFSMSTPYYQSFALRTLNTLWKDFPGAMEGMFQDAGDMTKGKLKDFSVSFEATHHGPYVNTPAFFIEIGSTGDEWIMRKPAMLLAGTIYKTIEEWTSQASESTETRGDEEKKTGIGVGGGHYTPRFTKYLLSEGYDLGHIVPGYACELLDENLIKKLLKRTPDAGTIFVHGKKNRKFAEQFLGVKPGLEILVLK